MQKTEKLKEGLRKYALGEGLDMIGFASVDRFADAPEEFHPKNIYPDVKTVVVIGIRVLRGLMESLDEGMHIPYNAHGYGGINEWFMRDARQKVACWIEDHGYSAVPVIQWTGTPHQEPIMCHRTAAVAAGLGEFGWSKILLTKKFGPLQRFGIVLTNAELSSDPLQIGKICDKCMACVRACPGKAIPQKESFSITIDGNKISHAKVDMFQCTKAHHGGTRETHPRLPDNFDISEIDRKYEKLRKASNDDTADYALGGAAAGEVQSKYPHPIFGLVGNLTKSCAYCGARGCFRACLEHLEKRGLIEKRFLSRYESKAQDKSRIKKSVRKAKGHEVYTE